MSTYVTPVALCKLLNQNTLGGACKKREFFLQLGLDTANLLAQAPNGLF
jgi:hypothetical protein